MKNAVKVFAIVGIVLGAGAIIGSLEPVDGYGLLGGGIFLGWGIVDLCFLSSLKKK